MMTFNVHGDANPPPVIQLKPSENEQSRFVLGRKIERADFKALLEKWK